MDYDNWLFTQADNFETYGTPNPQTRSGVVMSDEEAEAYDEYAADLAKAAWKESLI